MKKMMLFVLAVAILGVGCASTGTTQTATTNQPLTLEEALKKSAETRQQLEQAKRNYQTAKTAAEVAGGNTSGSDAVQTQVKKQINTAKTQIEAEKDAWADLLK